jgi:hypothetical protein
LKLGPIVCPETSVRNYHYSLRNSPQKRSSQGSVTLETKQKSVEVMQKTNRITFVVTSVCLLLKLLVYSRVFEEKCSLKILAESHVLETGK